MAVECNCSICAMKRNTHVIIPASRFHLLQGEDAIVLYQAQFCAILGYALEVMLLLLLLLLQQQQLPLLLLCCCICRKPSVVASTIWMHTMWLCASSTT